MKTLKLIIAASLIGGTAWAMPKMSANFGTNIANTNVQEAEVQAAQEAWCNALVSIAQEGEKRGQKRAAKLAGDIIDAAYGYQMGPVLFKPTLTYGEQTFRTTRAGALAYFVGGDKSFPNDKGFALNGWQACTFKNAAVHINGDVALTQGNVMITGKDGKVTTVDKTWAFKKDDQGKLRIVLHHSSLPFSPN